MDSAKITKAEPWQRPDKAKKLKLDKGKKDSPGQDDQGKAPWAAQGAQGAQAEQSQPLPGQADWLNHGRSWLRWS